MPAFSAINVLMARVNGGSDSVTDLLDMSLSLWLGNYDQTSVAFGVHGADTEDHVVFGVRQVDFCFRGADGILVRKIRICRLAPQDFIRCGPRGGLPFNLGVVLQLLGQKMDFRGRGRRRSERG